MMLARGTTAGLHSSSSPVGAAVSSRTRHERSRGVYPAWARWNGGVEQRYTLGVEEEVMLLDPATWSLAQSSDQVLLQLSDDLSSHAAPIDSAVGRLIPVRESVATLRASCRPHARVLGCTGALDRVEQLAASNGAERQCAFVAANRPLDELVATLADHFPAFAWRATTDGADREPQRAGACMTATDAPAPGSAPASTDTEG